MQTTPVCFSGPNIFRSTGQQAPRNASVYNSCASCKISESANVLSAAATVLCLLRKKMCLSLFRCCRTCRRVGTGVRVLGPERVLIPYTVCTASTLTRWRFSSCCWSRPFFAYLNNLCLGGTFWHQSKSATTASFSVPSGRHPGTSSDEFPAALGAGRGSVQPHVPDELPDGPDSPVPDPVILRQSVATSILTCSCPCSTYNDRSQAQYDFTFAQQSVIRQHVLRQRTWNSSNSA